MLVYKRFLIVSGVLVAAMLLGFGIIKVAEYDRMHPQKYICTKSHTKSEYVYGYDLDPSSGEMKPRWHWEYTDVCDKKEINPKWKALNE